MARRKQKRLGNYQRELGEARLSLKQGDAECRPAKAAIQRAERLVKANRGKLGWQGQSAAVKEHIRMYERVCGRRF